ncbi:MAG: PQQ-dependent sugar dehydrogenase [Euryarchaeota archaeon]|nr:PQQ-dependent sugar dehydrogenase [Euryarchaeota archaeon]
MAMPTVLKVLLLLLLVALVAGARGQGEAVQLERVAEGASFPVDLAWAPDGRMFVAERFTGKIRLAEYGILALEPWARLDVVTQGEQGLLGIAVDPDWNQSPYLYAYITAPGPVNRVVRIRDGGGRGETPEVIFKNIPASTIHNGGILAFGPDGKLYITTGDANQPALAQDVKSAAGKVLRIEKTGAIPRDNPWPGSPAYTRGHRNVFGLAFQPGSGRAYITENGPSRDDEFNHLLPGLNYGWPDYLGRAGRSDVADPLLTWTPNIAPTQVAFHNGSLYFGDWNQGDLHRATLSAGGTRVEDHVTLLRMEQGILDVASGPDGWLYLTTPSGIYRVPDWALQRRGYAGDTRATPTPTPAGLEYPGPPPAPGAPRPTGASPRSPGPEAWLAVAALLAAVALRRK